MKPAKHFFRRFTPVADKIIWVALAVALLSALIFCGANEAVIIPCSVEMRYSGKDVGLLWNLQQDYETLSQDDIASRLSELYSTGLMQRLLKTPTPDALASAEDELARYVKLLKYFITITTLAGMLSIGALFLCGLFWLNRKLTSHAQSPSPRRLAVATLSLLSLSGLVTAITVGILWLCRWLLHKYSLPGGYLLLPFCFILSILLLSFFGACVGAIPGFAERLRRKKIYGAIGGAVGITLSAFGGIIGANLEDGLFIAPFILYTCWTIAIIISERNTPEAEPPQAFPRRSWQWMLGGIIVLTALYNFLPVPCVPVYYEHTTQRLCYAPNEMTPELRQGMSTTLTQYNEWNKSTSNILWIRLHLLLDKDLLRNYTQKSDGWGVPQNKEPYHEAR